MKAFADRKLYVVVYYVICLWKVENIAVKGENFGDHHCPLFKNLLLQGINPFLNKPWFLCVCSKSLLKTLGKGEIACYEQFLLFPVFSTCLEKFLLFSLNSKLSSAISFSLEESKICHLGKCWRRQELWALKAQNWMIIFERNYCEAYVFSNCSVGTSTCHWQKNEL